MKRINTALMLASMMAFSDIKIGKLYTNYNWQRSDKYDAEQIRKARKKSKRKR